MGIVEGLTRLIAEVWQDRDQGGTRGHTYRCQCGRPVFFRNSVCLACQTPLGYIPERSRLEPLKPAGAPDTFTTFDQSDSSRSWRRCANLTRAAACNWLVDGEDAQSLCRSCRLNRTIPSEDNPDNQRAWRVIETAKRRLVAQLLDLNLPVRSKVNEDPECGVMFDFLRSPAEGPRVLTGHASGLITLNIEEADDAAREKIKQDLHEPYRTLLGHFRHEIGHYYWDRLIAGTPWHEKFRGLFGDERADYGESLEQHYAHGAPADWARRYITPYASSHPWEDWAETWAHYLHIVDSLDTALGFGLRGNLVELDMDEFTKNDLYEPDHPQAERLLVMGNAWLKLTTVLNEMARSMGEPDFYPFVMPRAAVRKLQFIQMVVEDSKSGAAVREA